MAITKVLARTWVKEINIATVWTDINGINSFTVANSKQDTDITDFESAGFGEHLVAARGSTITLEGFFMEDTANGNRDPGQAGVEALALLFGPSSIGQFRLTSPGGTVSTFYASVQTDGPGGDNNAAATWKVTLHVSGAVVVT